MVMMIGDLSKNALKHFVVIEKVIVSVEKVIYVDSVVSLAFWAGIPTLQK